jgi:hypothetical protein
VDNAFASGIPCGIKENHDNDYKIIKKYDDNIIILFIFAKEIWQLNNIEQGTPSYE